jgi:inner membrane protein
MPTILTHAVSATALTSAFPIRSVPRRLIILGAICAMAPDLDVFGFRFGIRYGALWGHRGLMHSLLFALCLSLLAWFAGLPYVAGFARRKVLWLYLFLCSASHGVLDAFTNGGLGIAFFSPFDTARYFFPFRPIRVSPIGADFFPPEGVSVLHSEFIWVWVPCIVFAIVAFWIRNMFGHSTALTERSSQRQTGEKNYF